MHFFDSSELEWQPHPRFADVRYQQFESRATHPTGDFSMMRVRLAPGGVIDTHVHERETETAYVLSGEGLLTCGPGTDADDEQHRLTPGRGVSIPPMLAHRLSNHGAVEIEIIAIHSPPIM